MNDGHTLPITRKALWALLVLGLLALRVPAAVEPLGNDQSLYTYVADRLRSGEVPYVDAWDQKPPAIFFLYAGLRAIWPHSSVIAVADLGAAAVVAWGLVLLGRRTIGETEGWTAASIFLLLGHPSLSRVSGVYVRGQCETFIAAAITMALALLVRSSRARRHLILAGVWLGLAFWLKYNAVAYAPPIVVAAWLWPSRFRTEAGPSGPADSPGLKPRPPKVLGSSRFSEAVASAPADPRRIITDIQWLVAGFASVGAAMLTYFAAHHALDALRLATIDYNVRYSAETYAGGWIGAVTYIAAMPIHHARTEMIWFLGCAGAAALVVLGTDRRAASLTIGWLAAVVLSIAVNGARELPQYFVQAAPALAFAAAAGLSLAWRQGALSRAAAIVVVLAGLWRVGVEPPSFAGLKLAGLPELADNIAFDTSYMAGRIDRRQYLGRFKGEQKYDAQAVEDLAAHVRATTAPTDRILVFGFAPDVYVQSERQSASRFFWSRPVILEFAADRAGYGSAGLLQELRQTRPALVALQKRDWEPDVANSMAFFQSTPVLNDWLTSGYDLDQDTPLFSVWRRKS